MIYHHSNNRLAYYNPLATPTKPLYLKPTLAAVSPFFKFTITTNTHTMRILADWTERVGGSGRGQAMRRGWKWRRTNKSSIKATPWKRTALQQPHQWVPLYLRKWNRAYERVLLLLVLLSRWLLQQVPITVSAATTLFSPRMFLYVRRYRYKSLRIKHSQDTRQ